MQISSALIPIHSGRIMVSLENNAPVLTTTFDHSSLDSPEDILKERLNQRVGALQVCQEFLKEQNRDIAKHIALDFIRKFLAVIVSEAKPLLFIDYHLWASGLAAKNFWTIEALAKKHGVSKQAFQQGAEKIRTAFNYPLNEMQRKEESRANMVGSRRPKI